MLRACKIAVTRADSKVLAGVSLSLAAGELVAAIGRNGAGKSTLLQVLSGALAPNAGHVELDGHNLAAWSRQALARRRAVLPQETLLGFPFRALEVVLLGRSPHAGGTGRKQDLRIAEAAMRETDVLHLADRLYATLSGGESQRVQLARVLAQVGADEHGEGTRYLLLDEPTNNLDLSHQHATLKAARRFARRGNVVFAVLHDPNLAALYADRIAIVDAGRIAAEGAPSSVLTEEILRETLHIRVHIQRHPTRGGPVIVVA